MTVHKKGLKLAQSSNNNKEESKHEDPVKMMLPPFYALYYKKGLTATFCAKVWIASNLNESPCSKLTYDSLLKKDLLKLHVRRHLKFLF